MLEVLDQECRVAEQKIDAVVQLLTARMDELLELQKNSEELLKVKTKTNPLALSRCNYQLWFTTTEMTLWKCSFLAFFLPLHPEIKIKIRGWGGGAKEP